MSMAEPGFGAPRRPEREGRSLGELVRDLVRDSMQLVRAEIALARAEMTGQIGRIGGGVARVAAGGGVLLVGLLVLVEFLVLLVGRWLGEIWLGALLVAVVLLGLGGLFVWQGVWQIGRKGLKPEETLATVRDTGAWARAEVREARSDLASGRVHHSPAPTPAARTAAPPAGATAQQSSEKSAAGAGGLARAVLKEFKADDISNQAAKVAYYFFMSLPSVLLALFALTGLFGGPKTADWLTRQLSGSLPAEAGGLVGEFVDTVVHQSAPGLFSVGLLLALWSGSNVFMSMEDTLNVAYDVTEKRGFVRKRLVALATMLVCLTLFLLASAVLLAGPAIVRGLGFGTGTGVLWTVLRLVLGFLVTVATFFTMYYVLPNRDQSHLKGPLLKASALSAALWLLATLAFRFYVSNFGSYSKTYGLLGGVIVLLLWLYLTSNVILLGGEISSEMERRAEARG